MSEPRGEPFGQYMTCTGCGKPTTAVWHPHGDDKELCEDCKAKYIAMIVKNPKLAAKRAYEFSMSRYGAYADEKIAGIVFPPLNPGPGGVPSAEDRQEFAELDIRRRIWFGFRKNAVATARHYDPEFEAPETECPV